MNRIARLMAAGVVAGKKPLESLSLEDAMLRLFNVSYWPMTESSGNGIDH